VYGSTRNTHLCITLHIEHCEHLERFDPCGWGHCCLKQVGPHTQWCGIRHQWNTIICYTAAKKPENSHLHFASVLPACIHSNFFSMVQQPLVRQCLLIIEVSCWHSDTPHLVGLLGMSDQSNTETSTWQYMVITRDRHSCLWWVWTHSPGKQVATDSVLKRCGHWDQHVYGTLFHIRPEQGSVAQ